MQRTLNEHEIEEVAAVLDGEASPSQVQQVMNDPDKATLLQHFQTIDRALKVAVAAPLPDAALKDRILARVAQTAQEQEAAHAQLRQRRQWATFTLRALAASIAIAGAISAFFHWRPLESTPIATKPDLPRKSGTGTGTNAGTSPATLDNAEMVSLKTSSQPQPGSETALGVILPSAITHVWIHDDPEAAADMISRLLPQTSLANLKTLNIAPLIEISLFIEDARLLQLVNDLQTAGLSLASPALPQPGADAPQIQTTGATIHYTIKLAPR